MRLLGTLAVMAAAVISAPVITNHPAGASCAAPVLTFKPTKVARGATLTISGQNLGEECLDTGTLPQGVGPLGAPMTGLTIVIDQGTNEFVVATGSADSRYSFQVDVVVPLKLEAGEATLSVLGGGDGRLTMSPSLVISTAPPVRSAEAPTATFGPPTTPDTEPSGTDPPTVLPAEIPDLPVATAPSASAAPIEDTNDNTDLERAIGVGVAGVVAVGATAFAVWARVRRKNDTR
ncbi:MAG: hypothetical protein ACXV8K_18505 [Ilumatobacteraceae bacterium]